MRPVAGALETIVLDQQPTKTKATSPPEATRLTGGRSGYSPLARLPDSERRSRPSRPRLLLRLRQPNPR
jgi:hypothetical protein